MNRSTCCEAEVYQSGICANCKEECEVVKDRNLTEDDLIQADL